MALYLVQHGRSFAKDQDPEQGLTPEGAAEVERIANVAAYYGVQVSRIRHSGKKRALQTAELYAAALKPAKGVESAGGLNPLDDVRQLAAQLTGAENLMLVGHLPFMERLAGYLITGSSETLVFKFQNGGVVCLDHNPEKNSWFIKWALMPKVD